MFKKRIIFYSIFILLIVGYFNAEKLWDNVNAYMGNFHYENKDYVKAYSCFKKAFNADIDNTDNLEVYYETLKKLNKIPAVQNELIKIKNNYEDSIYSALADSELEKIKYGFMQDKENTYIDNVSFGSKILRWNIEEGLLKVFIGKEGSYLKIPGYYDKYTQEALNDWEKVFDKELEFKVVNDINEADIAIIYSNKLIGENCNSKSSCKIVTGLTQPLIKNNKLKKMNIRLRVKNVHNKYFSKFQFYNTALHEIGHALGIMGHSYDEYDVMFPVKNDTRYKRTKDGRGKFVVKRKRLSHRDIATINALYEIIPDITNKEYNQYQTVDMVYPEVVLGSQNHMAAKKVRESKRYLNTVSGNAISWMTMADSYSQNKEYEKSEQAYRTALEYVQNKEQTYTIYHNIAIMKYQQEEFEQAVSFAQKASKYYANKSNEIIAFSYLGMQDFKNAEKFLKKLIKKEPKNIEYSYGLIVAYLKEFKLPEAGREITRIKRSNPVAETDDRISKLKFISMIFK